MKSPFSALLMLVAAAGGAHGQSPEVDSGTAIAIVYDTSGSMGEIVKGPGGKGSPKYKVANDALFAVAKKINEFAKKKRVEACLVTFRGTAVPLQKWNSAPFVEWSTQFKSPSGRTPLGEAMRNANDQLSNSSLPRKHIVVITDGASNGSLSPGQALDEINSGSNPPRLYVVAFDTQSEAFKPLKDRGACIAEADDRTLAAELSTIFGEKILLEAED